MVGRALNGDNKNPSLVCVSMCVRARVPRNNEFSLRIRIEF